MRPDFNKLLCEHERIGSSAKFKLWRSKVKNTYFKDPENTPNRLSTGKIYGYETKSFSENLNPLWGFIRKNVGRKWDDVYSEICKTFDKRSVINQHILSHLNGFVATKVFEEDGKFFERSKYYHKMSVDSYEYFVHPKTGILTKSNYKSYNIIAKENEDQRKKELLKIKRVKDSLTEAHRIDGIWYEFKFKQLKLTKMYRPVLLKGNFYTKEAYMGYPLEECLLGVALKNAKKPEHLSTFDYNYYNLPKRVAYEKKTMSKKELKEYGIK